MQLAHGVGRVYELPIPLGLYLFAAAATVALSFFLRAFSTSLGDVSGERRLLGATGARAVVVVLKVTGVLGLLLTVVSGIVVREVGTNFTTLAFWVGLVVGMTLLNALMTGAWTAADPWRTAEDFYRLEEPERTSDREPPWFVGPLLLFALFWFELISGVGFDAFWVVLVLIAYSLFFFTWHTPYREAWDRVDPFAILFGFAGRSAPLRLTREGMWLRNPLAGLDRSDAMHVALYASVFVLLASTTLDNVKETVGWSSFLSSTGLDELPPKLLETLALAAFTVPFLLSYLLALKVAERWIGKGADELPRRFAWSLVPIGVAYVLAHNTPLLISGLPQLFRMLSDPFEQGWNLLGTADAFPGFFASPRLVWFLEIALIVGGHVLGVLAAHRTAVRLAPDHKAAVRSQYALTALMSVYTITTLWLLAQPLVD